MLSWYEPVRLHFLPTHTVLFYSFLMPWVRKSFLLLSALAGELFYLSLSALPAQGGLAGSWQLPAGIGAAPRRGGDETGCSKKCSWLPLDPVSVGVWAQGSGSADTRRGQAVHCSCWNDCSAGGRGKLFQLGFKSERAPYCRGKERVPRWPRFPLKGLTSTGRGSDLVTFLSLR